MNQIVKISKFRCGLLLSFVLLAIVAAPVHAADPTYNVSQVTFSESGAASQYYRITTDLTVSWTPPTVAVPPMNYYLKFNTSPTKLSDAEFNDAVYDFKVAGSLDHTVPAIPKATFDAYDYPQEHYLHIKTQFPTGDAAGFAFSEDVVIGPLLIDNVAPGGTMTLTPSSGSSRKVNVTLSPVEPLRWYWLSESSTYSPSGEGTSGSFLSLVWDLQSTAIPPPTVSVPIYAWFQDMAGNRSTTYAATATYDYTATVEIVYNSSSVEVGGTLGFTVDGTTPYDWTITPSVAGVASIASGDTPVTKANAASITVNGLKAGTFTVSALPHGSLTGELTSGVITVVQGYIKGRVNNDEYIDSGDAILILRYSVGLIALTDTQKAAGNVTGKTSNDAIDSGDAIKILRYSVGLIGVL